MRRILAAFCVIVTLFASAAAAGEDFLLGVAPDITDITPTADGKVVITVSNVVPYVPYAITCGETPNALTQKDVASVFSLSDGVLTITVANPGANRFFKVTSK